MVINGDYGYGYSDSWALLSMTQFCRSTCVAVLSPSLAVLQELLKLLKKWPVTWKNLPFLPQQVLWLHSKGLRSNMQLVKKKWGINQSKREFEH